MVISVNNAYYRIVRKHPHAIKYRKGSTHTAALMDSL